VASLSHQLPKQEACASDILPFPSVDTIPVDAPSKPNGPSLATTATAARSTATTAFPRITAAEAATGMFIRGDTNSPTLMCEAATSSADPTMIHGEASNGLHTVVAIALLAADKNRIQSMRAP
jgi:hypothetical protein